MVSASTLSSVRPAAFRAGARRTRAARSSVSVRAERVLIVNTPSGGHANLGGALAGKLLSAGHTVTIMQDGNFGKPYFACYNSMPGLTVVEGKPDQPATFPAGDFDVVVDNNGKNMDACKPLIDFYAGKVMQHVFIASAGAYVPNPVTPICVEGDARKASAGHVEVEGYLETSGTPYTVFQPQYLYGLNIAKDQMRYFMDRIVRDRPVCIPSSGAQLTTLTNVEDAAAMVAAAVANPAAIKQQYNLVSDRPVSHDGIVLAMAKAMGKDPQIIHYDPKAVEVPKKEAFPFRPGHFVCSAAKAQKELGFTCMHSLEGDAPALVAEYMAAGRAQEDIDFTADNNIMAAVGKVLS